MPTVRREVSQGKEARRGAGLAERIASEHTTAKALDILNVSLLT